MPDAYAAARLKHVVYERPSGSHRIKATGQFAVEAAGIAKDAVLSVYVHLGVSEIDAAPRLLRRELHLKLSHLATATEIPEGSGPPPTS